MSNVLSEEKIQQVIALGRLGWTLRRIQRETGVRRETAANYLKAAGIELRTAGNWRRVGAKPAIEVTPDPEPEAKPATEVTPDSGVPSGPVPGRSPTASTCEPYRDLIEVALARGRNAKAIWQDLVDDHGFRGTYQSVKRFARKLHGGVQPVASAVIQTQPGEEAQVDYGTGPMVCDPHSGRYCRTRLFVLTLGYSRKSVRLLTFRSSTRIWAELHERAFRRLGGVARLIILDNLREGILEPDVYDPRLNPLYRDMLAPTIASLPCHAARVTQIEREKSKPASPMPKRPR